jgi:hypothetical protein
LPKSVIPRKRPIAPQLSHNILSGILKLAARIAIIPKSRAIILLNVNIKNSFI